MNRNASVNLGWPVLVVAAALLLATGSGAAYLILRSGDDSRAGGGRADIATTTAPGGGLSAPASRSVPSGAASPDIVITLSQEAVDRAGIRVDTVVAGGATVGLRLPGVVEPNAYRRVVVTPLVGGRITRVLVELGQRVRRGQTMAQVFSPELAVAHTRYTSARAELEAHERELGRTEKLVEIGAASRQELERVHAEHTARTADVQSARSRLELLGVPAAALEVASGEVRDSADVPAPIDGVVTQRLANVGLNVDLASELFTIVDLSTVWVVADLYERDFSRVRVGNPATVTTAAYPDLAVRGRVSYIDPQVSAETRTAKLRVEVQNPRLDLRLGMYVDVQMSDSGRSDVPVMPRSAVQTVDNRQVVYLVDPRNPGTFTEREVQLGPATGERVEVRAGVEAGDVVVKEGSFFLRAERDRLGLATSRAAVSAAASAQAGNGREPGASVQTARVIVGEQGYEPAELSLRAGAPARITFVRTTDKTCGTEVVFPSLNLKRVLPLNEPVVIEFTPARTGDIAFACGMNMLHGTIVVQ